PKQRLEDVHRQEVSEGEIERGDHGAERGERLRESRCAEASRDCAGEEHERGVGERGNDANGEERCAESVSNEPGEKADERRLIDVTPIEMLTAGEVVKLVAKVAVLRDADEMNENGERGEHCYHRRNAVWPHSAARWR